MMRAGRKTVTVFLCMLLAVSAFAGCKKKQKETSAETGNETQSLQTARESQSQVIGGYVEEEIEMPPLIPEETVIGIYLDHKENWRVYTAKVAWLESGPVINDAGLYSRPYRYGGTEQNAEWIKEPAGWIKEIFSSAGKKNFIPELPKIVEGEDGNEYAFIQYRYTSKTKENRIVVYRRDKESGGVKRLKLTGDISDFTMSYTGAVTKAGDIVLGTAASQAVCIYSGRDGKLLAVVDFNQNINAGSVLANQSPVKVAGDHIIGKGKKGISIYSEKQEKVIKEIPYQAPPVSKLCFSEGREGGLLIADRNGFHHITEEGTLWETLIEGFQTTPGLEKGTLLDIYLLGEREEEFAAVLQGEGFTDYKLLRYVFDKNKPKVDQTLTVYSLYYNYSVQEYINSYQLKHRDIRVEYIVGKEEDGASAGDAIRALNTELLNGKGPDVLILDGLPAVSYGEKGILCDISGVVLPLADSGVLLKNIISPYVQEGGKMYRVPLEFHLPWATGKKEAVECLGSAGKMAVYMKSGNGTPFMDKLTYEELSKTMLLLEYTSLLEGAAPDSRRIKEFLESVKITADNTGAAPEVIPEGKALAKLLERKIDLMIHELRFLNPWDAHIGLYLKNKEGMAFKIINHSFIPEQIFGIYAGSREKERATDFLRYCLAEGAEEVLEVHKKEGIPMLIEYHTGHLPIYEKLLKEQFAEEITTTVAPRIVANGREYKFETQLKDFMWLLDEIKTLNQPIEVDQELFDAVADSTVSYLSGSVTADQAANEICSRIRLYQAERE